MLERRQEQSLQQQKQKQLYQLHTGRLQLQHESKQLEAATFAFNVPRQSSVGFLCQNKKLGIAEGVVKEG